MPDPNAREASADREENSNPGAAATAIHHDFQLLVNALTNQMDLLEDASSEVVVQLTKAKRAAERGVEISDRLLKSIAGRTS